MKTAYQTLSEVNTPKTSYRSVRYRVRSTTTQQSSRKPQTRGESKELDMTIETTGLIDDIPRQNFTSVGPRKRAISRQPPSKCQDVLFKSSNDWSYMIPAVKPVLLHGYIQSFHSLMDSRSGGARIGGTVDWRHKSRVSLPVLEDNEQSKFSTLDPIPVSVDFIQVTLLSFHTCANFRKTPQ